MEIIKRKNLTGVVPSKCESDRTSLVFFRSIHLHGKSTINSRKLKFIYLL